MNEHKTKSTHRYNKYDLDNDGTVDYEEIERSRTMFELEIREEKAAVQKKMSWIALISMIVATCVLFSPIISDSRVAALADLLGLFYIAQASVVGFYFGAQAYVHRTTMTKSKLR